MIALKYERLSHFLAIAATEPNDANLSDLRLNQSEVLDKHISISFSDYVKSQLHYYMSTKLCKKSFIKYIHVYKYFDGDISYKNEMLELLRCYYQDIATFLLHSDVDLHITLVVDVDIDDVWTADLGKTRRSISELLQYSQQADENFKEYLDSSKYAWILDFIENPDDGESKINNYSLAASLFEMLQETKTYKYEEVTYDTQI